MLMNYQSEGNYARMDLKEALKHYSNDILYLTLKDGTNIEIIPDKIPEMGYMDNQLSRHFEENDEFIEEKLEENPNNLLIKQMMPKQPGPLRGRGQKKFGKSLRKTVLKSMNGNEKEKKIEKNGKLRNTNDNLILKITENNDFIQCANCFKFFPPDEDEDNTKKESSIPQNVRNDQKLPSNYPKQIQPNYPQQQQQKYPLPQNPQMMMPQPPQVKPGPGQKIPHSAHNQQQQYTKVIPTSKQQQNIVQRKNVPGMNNIRPNQPPPMNMQFRGGQNQVFRARKKTKNRYDSNNDRYFNSNNNNINYVTTEVNYYYPASGKKPVSSNYQIYEEYEEYPSQPKLTHNSSYGNLNVAKNLKYGFNKVSNEIRYADADVDNNMDDYLNNTDYYNNSYQYQNNIVIPDERNYNNHKEIDVKNVSNQYNQYQDYNDYEYYY